MDTNIRQIDKEITAGILSALKGGKKTVTYGELSRDIKAHTGRYVDPFTGFSRPLGNIQTYCFDCGVPCLSSVVVNKSGQQVPGQGFLSRYQEIHPEDHRSIEDILQSEQERCASQEDWSPLLEYCGIASESIWDASSPTFDFEVLNWSMLVKILDSYEKDLDQFREEELYKWEAARCFQEHWNIDAPDFSKMIASSLEKTDNLLNSFNYYSLGMIKWLARNDPEGLRASFKRLFDEDISLAQRLKDFSSDMDIQLDALNRIQEQDDEHTAKSHYQDSHAMSVYLAFAPNSPHYLYKSSLASTFFAQVGYASIRDKFKKVVSYEQLCDMVLDYLVKYRPDIVQKSDALLDDSLKAADPRHHLLVQDIVYYAGTQMAQNWAYAPGENAKFWDEYRANNTMGIGWDEIGDPSQYKNQTELKEALAKAYGVDNPANDTKTIWLFVHEIKPGDTIWARRGIKTVISRGMVRSDFRYDPTRDHHGSVRNVDWDDIAEFEAPGTFHQKTLYKLTEKTSVKVSDLIERAHENDDEIEPAEEDPPVVPSAKVEQYNDEDFLNEVYVSDTDLSTMKRLLERKKNLILQGAPGTGKTYCAKRLAWAYMEEKDNSRIQLVQFHQNTTYDDMMAGYKPSDDGGFEPVAGEFLRFCDKAAHDREERPWFFIIDEINRANISKVFGEMLMLIEANHRNESVMLPLLGRNVMVPSNLYLIGMMNTADRGLALIDYALRRRFAFFEMEPAFANQRFKNAMETLGNDKLSALAEKVNHLNEEIAKDPSFGTGFRIGHSYFCFDDSVSDEEVRDVIEFELAPLIREYWFDDPDAAKSKIEALRSVL